MFLILSQTDLIAFLLVTVLAWIAGSKAGRLAYGGTAARTHRKTRKLLFWSAFVSAPSLAGIAAIFRMAGTMDDIFWLDRVLLHLPLAAISLLAVWLLAVPRLWRLWRNTGRPSDGPLPRTLLLQAAHPLVIVPFQTMAMGAAVIVYFNFAPPVPLDLTDAIVPVAVWIIAAIASWTIHDRRWQRIGRAETVGRLRPWRRTLRGLGLLGAFIVIAGAALWMEMANSRLPDRLNMAEGPMDFGGGTELIHDPKSAVSVAMLTGPREGEPDRKFTLTAQRKTVELGNGKSVEAWTFNGQLPGPELRMKRGELIEVTLINRDVESGVTLHWHGLDVPNAEDGVAGATQDAVLPGGRHVYRFVAGQTGTFWYHSHQTSAEAVRKGLFGPLIVEPAEAEVQTAAVVRGESAADVTVMTHIWERAGMSIGTNNGLQRKQITPGTPVRLRLVNTDDWVRQQYTLIGVPFKVAAFDGTELNAPGQLTDTTVTLTTGGRADLTFVMPDRPVFLAVGDGARLGLLMSGNGTGEPPERTATAEFDLTHYGEPAATPIDAGSNFDREFAMILDNKLGFFDGSFDMLYTINGKVFPEIPMFMVREHERIKVTIANRGSVEHPMHLHGHHMLVLSRNGEEVGGSPWWSDTLDVLPGETFEVAFTADNPGIWMDHCHNLAHAAVGMSMHLMYEGVTTPYTVGRDTVNHPE